MGDSEKFFSKTYLDHAKNSPKKIDFKDKGYPGIYLCLNSTEDGICYFAIWNESEKTTIHVK